MGKTHLLNKVEATPVRSMFSACLLCSNVPDIVFILYYWVFSENTSENMKNVVEVKTAVNICCDNGRNTMAKPSVGNFGFLTDWILHKPFEGWSVVNRRITQTRLSAANQFTHMDSLSYHYSNRCKISAVYGNTRGRHLGVLYRLVWVDVNQDILYASANIDFVYLKNRYCFHNEWQEKYTVLD